MLANSGFLPLVLVLTCAILCTGDDGPFLQRIDSFRGESIVTLNETFGFERLGRLVNETRKTMEFFAWLGHLFMNGTVGHCNDTVSEGKCTIVFGADGSETLRQNVFVIFKEMYSFQPVGRFKHFKEVFYDKWRTDDFARRAMDDSNVPGIAFTPSKYFYWRWALFIWGQHLVNSTHDEAHTNGYRSDVSDHCNRAMKTRSIRDAKMNAIVALTYLMGPECDRTRDETGEYFEREYEQYREEYFNLSDYRGFNGGNTNRCFQKFLIRYSDYNKRTNAFFVDYLAKYLFQSISFYGYCLPIVNSDQEERESWISWAVESLEVLQTQLVDALDVFNETPSDQPFMQRIDLFRERNIEPINSSFGIERLKNVVYRTRDVMEFFAWTGSLFTTGILGHWDKWVQREEIYVGADGSKQLQQYVLTLFVDMYAIGNSRNSPISENPFVRLFHRKGDDGMELAIQLARGIAKGFMANYFYDKWINEEVGVRFNASSPNNETRGHYAALRAQCELGLRSYDEKPPPLRAIKTLLYLIRPGCELEKDWRDKEWNSYLETLQFSCNELAKIHGFAGGESNRCFQKFMVRYTDYNRTTYETFVDYLGKYLFQEISVYAYCLATTWSYSEEREDWINWAQDGLITILEQLSDAFEIFDEPRPTVITAVRPTVITAVPPTVITAVPTTDLTSTLSRKMPDVPTASAQYSDQAVDATATSGSITVSVLEHVVDSVLPSAGIKGPMAWAQRADTHQTIAKKIYDELGAPKNARYGVSFQVLVSLLQDKDQSDMQCMGSTSNRHIKSFNSYGVSYFMQYFKPAILSAGLNGTWNDIQDKDADILDAVFSSKTQDLCKTTKDEIEKAVGYKVFGSANSFSGLAVVRCGRRFVWYQLGYRYFPVGRTAGPSFALASGNDETYDSNCGQIFLFP